METYDPNAPLAKTIAKEFAKGYVIGMLKGMLLHAATLVTLGLAAYVWAKYLERKEAKKA